ncbi:PrpF domain-containing protein [Paracoccus sp. DMF-8]|uniref:PrpF domain-containing protein n=1 Tax=Paracoccus sp. DMF-8 TaxID=3019445 RepID=UPI0023E88E70|nr:PrpF domain-containing protein [Paracoccus sp. DMF-8]MDF3606686.1 PrpF domain-containing protein [Paracoccus sp. DMF-8]
MSMKDIDDSLAIVVRNDVVEFPLHHMRGGTSTGIVIWEPLAPEKQEDREELLRHLMGVPLTGSTQGNRQTTGLGRGAATSNKAFFVRVEERAGKTCLVSTLAQLAADHSSIDWSVNCGNMSSALPLWAFDVGILKLDAEDPEIEIINTNTGVRTTGRLKYRPGEGLIPAEIPGVLGAHPGVDLFMHEPIGAKSGQLLPTGNVRDVFNDISASCVDVAVPMVIIRAADLGKTGYETIAELTSDRALVEVLRKVWVEAGQRMKLRNRNGELMTEAELARSETIPKVCMIAPPLGADAHIAVRYFTPQTPHASMAVSGGCCLAAATLIEGSIAREVARQAPAVTADEREFAISIENPAGILETTIVAKGRGADLAISTAAYRRSAQVLLSGRAPLYAASGNLRRALST